MPSPQTWLPVVPALWAILPHPCPVTSHPFVLISHLSLPFLTSSLPLSSLTHIPHLSASPSPSFLPISSPPPLSLPTASPSSLSLPSSLFLS